MTATAAISWHQANQRYLMALIRNLRDPLCDASDAAYALGSPAAIDTLCSAFELSGFERGILLLCAGVELDSEIRDRWGTPTFGAALSTLAEPHWSGLTPNAPLRRWNLIEVGAGSTLLDSPLRIDERVLHYLAGAGAMDARLEGVVRPVGSDALLPESQRRLAERISGVLVERGGPIEVTGRDSAGKREVCAAACARLGLQLYAMRAVDLPMNSRLWEREAALLNSALLIEFENGDSRTAVESFIENTRGPLLVSAREPMRWSVCRPVRFACGNPTAEEQRELWGQGLRATASGPLVDRLVAQFDLNAEAIHAACSQANDPAEVWDICRTNARSGLDGLAQRIDPAAGWADLVLPEQQTQTLREMAAQVEQRVKVYQTWGFAGKGARGLGISALFAGPSGTGKTMAAEVIAGHLQLDLYRIDLSQVVSKYIGETEKNLRRVFDAAEESGAVLLFDEADALFGKRSEVRDSHDRFANIEVGYLLQRMETYRGLAILTTNMKTVLDPAFLRRLRFVVQFPFPDSAARVEIWRRIFPTQTPLENVDPVKLSRMHVTGGNIRNIAIQAAFLAAGANQPVRMEHLLKAARSEYSKMDKTLSESETRGWA